MRNRRAFTFIELSICLAILGVITLLMLNWMAPVRRFQWEQETRLDVASEALALERALRADSAGARAIQVTDDSLLITSGDAVIRWELLPGGGVQRRIDDSAEVHARSCTAWTLTRARPNEVDVALEFRTTDGALRRTMSGQIFVASPWVGKEFPRP